MKKTILLLLLSALTFYIQAQSLVTVAGIGQNGNGGDNGSALLAQFSNMTGVAVDKHGNVYISDAAYNRVRKVDCSGNIYNYAGSPSGNGGYNGDNILAVNATLDSPCDVALDSAGNLYIADQFNGRIRRVDYVTGIITTVASGMSTPSGVAVDQNGNLYVAQQNGDLISKVNTFGVVTTLTTASSPYGIGVDPIGNVYYTSLGGSALKIDTAGNVTTVATGLSTAEGITTDYLGNIYIADGWGDQIIKVDHSTGVASTYIGTGGTINTAVGFEAGLCFDPWGNMYIVDNTDYLIQRLGSASTSTVVANFTANDTSICPGTSVSFSNLSTAGTFPQWSFPGGAPGASTLSSPQITYNTPGYYNVVLTVSNGCGSDSLLLANYIHVSNTAQAGSIVASEDTVCANSTVNLTLNNSSGNIEWLSSVTRDDFSVIIGDTSTTYSSPPLTQSIYYMVIASIGSCVDTSAILPVTVNPSPIPPVLSTPDSAFCGNDSTVVQSSGSYYSYLWNNNETSSFIYVNTTGDYMVTVTDADGCSAVSNPQHISVFPAIPIPTLSTPDSLICSSDSTKITASGGPYSSYLWNTGNTGNYIYTNYGGGYWVSVTDANGCSAVSGHQYIRVYQVPSVSIVEQGDTLYSFGAVSYQWYFDGSIIPGATSALYVAPKPGNYAVQITDTDGCTALSNNTAVNVLGISELGANSGLNVYPNPFTNTLFIENNNTAHDIDRVEIYDALGRLVYTEIPGSPGLSLLKLDVPSLPAGAYYVSVKRNGTENYYRQMIKLGGKN